MGTIQVGESSNKAVVNIAIGDGGSFGELALIYGEEDYDDDDDNDDNDDNDNDDNDNDDNDNDDNDNDDNDNADNDDIRNAKSSDSEGEYWYETLGPRKVAFLINLFYMR